jgi:ribosomal protein S27E
MATLTHEHDNLNRDGGALWCPECGRLSLILADRSVKLACNCGTVLRYAGPLLDGGVTKFGVWGAMCKLAERSQDPHPIRDAGDRTCIRCGKQTSVFENMDQHTAHECLMCRIGYTVRRDSGEIRMIRGYKPEDPNDPRGIPPLDTYPYEEWLEEQMTIDTPPAPDPDDMPEQGEQQ